ncbi:hypothetical protein AYO41_03575 [Verrucomicrobia bacterium SCGC AG-212-E04]|nr:hypothetical protein AYO41_03575 [Verrucomicrobia bacterium SCGC AG-212-E04]
MNPRSRWLTAAALVVIFVLGAVTGWLVGLSFRHPRFRPPRHEDMVAQMRGRLTRELALTPQQLEKIDPVVTQTAQDLDRIRRESDERVVKVLEEMHAKLAGTLTPEQVTKLAAMNERRRAMMKERREGPPPK